MALPAGMGLSAAAAAAGFSCQNPPPMTDAVAELPAQRAPEVALLGGLAELGSGPPAAADAALSPGLAAAAATATMAAAVVAPTAVSGLGPDNTGIDGGDGRSDPEEQMMQRMQMQQQEQQQPQQPPPQEEQQQEQQQQLAMPPVPPRYINHACSTPF